MSEDVGGRICPACYSGHSLRKNGHVRGRQRYRCRCGHQFTGGRPDEVVLAAAMERIQEVACRLIRAGVAVGTIASATGLSLSWVYQARRRAGSIAPGQCGVGGAGE